VEPGGSPAAEQTGGRWASALDGEGDYFGVHGNVPELQARSFRPGALGSSVMGRFFDEYMLSVVAHGLPKLHRE